MIINDKLIFAHVPKCAGNYVNTVLKKVDPIFITHKDLGYNLQDLREKGGIHSPINSVREYWKGRIKFTVLRSPYWFYVSMWSFWKNAVVHNGEDLFSEGRDRNFNKFVEHVLYNQKGTVDWFMDFDKMHYYGMGWYTFLFIHCCCSENTYDNFNEFFCYPMRYVEVDRILLLTTDINKKIHSFLSKMYPDIELLDIGKQNTSRHSNNLCDYYNDAMLKAVAKMDKPVFDVLFDCGAGTWEL